MAFPRAPAKRHNPSSDVKKWAGGLGNGCLVGNILGAGATAEQAASTVLPAFEINQKHLPPDTPVPANLAELTVTLYGHGSIIGEVSSKGHIDDHYQSLATLARNLAEYGHSLQPGQHVITGAHGKTPFAPGSYTGHFDQGIGTVTTHLTE